MSDQSYTEETLQFVTDVLRGRTTCPEEDARYVLGELAGAGLLRTSSPGRREEEWGVWWRSARGGIVMTRGQLPGRLAAEEAGRERVGEYDIASFTVRRREHRMFDDGSTLVGPWVEVDGSTADER